MALVGNGAELEADEVLAGGECGHCPWSPGGMSELGRVERVRQGRSRFRPLGSLSGTCSLPPGGTDRGCGWGHEALGSLSSLERGVSLRLSERRRC